ncbi:Lrp/AsnC family transcriptional regulator [Azospirillum sp. ST 5-10]|uniref:Lrp/AsnC family transcriptional regulator n=1 Tax=unclassified Azospirillum TaxID=2630922 RepID=UPI003F49FF27
MSLRKTAKGPSPRRNEPETPRARKAPAIDKTDRAILEILQQNASINNQDLASRVNLSPAPVSRRVKRLRDEGYIVKDVAIVNPERVGNSLIAFVDVELDRQREDVLTSFERRISEHREVQQCYFVSGESDYFLVITCRDMDHYNAFVRNVLSNEHNVKRFRTSFNLQRIKYDTSIYIGDD